MRLDVVVGSNGAGRTTFVRKVLLPSLPVGTAFVNADEIARRVWPDDPEAMSYEAATRASATRSALIDARLPFVAETVFSHPSKLDLIEDARSASFTVTLHVVLVPEELTVARVERRIAAGGHSVPEEKVRGRYRRMWSLVAEAAVSCDAATVYDNSGRGEPRAVVQLAHGVVVGAARWPIWTPEPLRRLS